MAGNKSEKKKNKAKEAAKKPNPIKNLISYVGDVKRELKKVAWPTRSDTLASTWVVIILSIIFSLFFFLCDSVLKFLMSLAFA
jgi:preprotein translocase subunit SecE